MTRDTLWSFGSMPEAAHCSWQRFVFGCSEWVCAGWSGGCAAFSAGMSWLGRIEEDISVFTL